VRGVPGPGTVQLETSIGANVARKASYSHHQKTIILDAEGWAPAGAGGGGWWGHGAGNWRSGGGDPSQGREDRVGPGRVWALGT